MSSNSGWRVPYAGAGRRVVSPLEVPVRKALFLVPVVFVLFIAAASAQTTTPPLGHIVVVALENHSYSEIVGSSSMPYLNSLISQYGLANNYYADTHGSLPNYLDVTTGEWVTLDDGFSAPVSINNIERELLNAGKTWKAYAQSLPSVGYTGGDMYPYVKHHNPFAYFSDNLNGNSQANNIVPLSQFSNDVAAATLPNFSFVIPDNEHNSHDCPDGTSNCTDATKLSTADQFLQNYLGPVLNNPQFQKDGLLVIWWDEGDLSDGSNGGGHVAITLVGPTVKPGYRSSTFYRHEHLLRTFEEALGLGYTGSTVYIGSMGEFFGSSGTGTGNGAISGRVTDISTGSGISGASVSYSGGSTTTSSSGNYSFSSVAPGTYTVKASASGYFTESVSASVTSGTTTTANIQLPTGGILAGTVTGSNGAALSGATVTVTGGKVTTTLTMTTNSSGGYNTSWVPVGTYTVTVSASGYNTQSNTATVNTGTTTTDNISLSSSGTTSAYSTITGQVTDISTGGAIGGATVSYGSTSTTANSSGYYTFSNVPAGTYSVTAVANGYFSRTESVTTTAGVTSTLNFQLATGGKVQGTVTNSSGAALASASVSITGGTVNTTVNTSTNSTGYYNSNWVPVGTYTVTVSASGYSTQSKTVSVTTGNTATLNFTLQ